MKSTKKDRKSDLISISENRSGIKLVPGPLGPWYPIRAEFMTITPDQASALLDGSTRRNRKRCGQRVYIANAIRDGNWRCNGESIILAYDGGINDGHNRLAACVDAKIPIRSLVVFGMDPEGFGTIDINARVRSAADVMYINGHEDAELLAGSACLAYLYLKGMRSQSVLSHRGETTERVEMIETMIDAGIKNSVEAFLPQRRTMWFLSPRASVALHFLFGLVDSKNRDEYFDKLVSGAGMAQGNPLLALRNRLIREPGPVHNGQTAGEPAYKVRNEHVFIQISTMIRTWNMYSVGRTTTKILARKKREKGRLVPDNLPDIAGLTPIIVDRVINRKSRLGEDIV